MKEGAVDRACKTAGMNTFCAMKDTNGKYNVDDCEPMAEPNEYWPTRDESTLVCGTSSPNKCPQLYGVFSAMKGWGRGECGVMPDQFCAQRSGFVSGPGSDYSVGSKSAQYYGLCSVPRGWGMLYIM